ncbi:hypothetical protein JHK85_051666 [Glycine max]|nr:hypothetical protein JHK85_051666 [Glycine max]
MSGIEYNCGHLTTTQAVSIGVEYGCGDSTTTVYEIKSWGAGINMFEPLAALGNMLVIVVKSTRFYSTLGNEMRGEKVEIKRTIWRGTAGWNSKDSRMKKIFMRRDIYGAWEQYLGLEHNDSAPKKSYAVNQNHLKQFKEKIAKLMTQLLEPPKAARDEITQTQSKGNKVIV